MSDTFLRRVHRWRAVLAGLSLTLLLSCSAGDGGAGGGIGGSGVTPIAAGDGVVLGGIDGFGSIVVNGRRYATDAAEFRVDGEPGREDALRVGMIVRAEVDFDAASASSVMYAATLRGRVESVDAAGERLVMLRQAVALRASTVLDGVNIATVQPGDLLEVSGLRNAAGTVIASFVRRGDPGTALQVDGVVEALDATARTLVIGGLVVDFAGADLGALDSALATGSEVVVLAPTDGYDAAAGRLVASAILPNRGAAATVGQGVDLEGIVTVFRTSDDFLVNGEPVRTSGSTAFLLPGERPGSPTALALNTRVVVTGEVQADGSIDATRVLIVPSEESRLVGSVEAVDAAARTVTVLGVPTRVTSATRFDEELPGFEGLRPGQYLRIDAAFVEDRLEAVRIERRDPDEEARLRGPVTRVDADAAVLEVLGIEIVGGDDSDYELPTGETDRDGFLRALSLGDVVEVDWDPFTSTSLPPDEIELEIDD